MDDTMDEATKFADRLFDLRRKAGYSQEQLADLLGVSRQAISKWEGAQGRPEVDNVVKLSQIYRVSTDYILTGSASVPSACETSLTPLAARAVARIPLCPQRPHGHRGDGARVRAGGLDLGHSFDGAYRRCGHPGMEVADTRSFARGDAPIRVLL